MKVAYYGLSSPIFYDYKTPIGKTINDKYDSPNPILDSAFGTILLFDEIWFFCKSLCPQNMRKLPYVKFLDEFYDVTELFKINPKEFWKEYTGEEDTEKRTDNMHANFETYNNVVKRTGVKWKAAPDNHTHSLEVAGNLFHGNSMNPDNVIFDLATVEYIKIKYSTYDIQLITNSFTQSWIESSDSILAKSKLTELLVIENIPNYLSRKGPYHECIEEVRDNSYLHHYRKWISEQKLKYDVAELKDVKKEVEDAINQGMKNQFLRYLEPESMFMSVSKNLIGGLSDTLLPGSTIIKSVSDNIREKKEKMPIMWHGFVISAKEQIK
jgi:hypothetical protein